VTEFRHKKWIVTDIRHNLWRTLTIPSQFVTESDQFVTKLWRIRHKIRHNSPVRHKNNLRCGIPPSEIVTDLPSQFPSQRDCDGKSPSQFFRRKKLWRTIFRHNCPSQIVTDPSQLHLWRMKLWRRVFRHNFINFSSQFPSQIASFPVVPISLIQNHFNPVKLLERIYKLFYHD